MTDGPVHARSPHADELIALIRTRRTVFDFLPDEVPAELLEVALDAGRFAPNHKLTEPWRFTIVGPVTKEAVAADWCEVALGKLPADASDERREEVRGKARMKWMSKPTIVVVTQVVAPDPVRAEEDYAAVACAIQNVQLAAWALGIGCQWSTNPATRDPGVLSQLRVGPDERVVAFLFLGYPSAPRTSRRKPLEEVLRRTP